MSSLQQRSRHASLIPKSKPTELNNWVDERKTRSLSVPDLHRLRNEWDTYQQSDTTHSISESMLQARKKKNRYFVVVLLI